MQKLKAVIFDFDGVVVDSLPVHLAAWRHACDKLFAKSILTFEHEIIGLATDKIASIIVKKLNSDLNPKVLAQYKRDLLKSSNYHVPLIHGFLECLDFLRQRQIPYGIASNAPRAFIADLLKYHNLEIETVLGIEDSPRPKPKPDIFLACATRLGIKFDQHQNIMVLEDSLHGLHAAVVAGMFAVGVTTQAIGEILISGGAVHCVNDHFESINLIKSFL